MIKEDYVSLEIAKLLREKGFDWDTYAYYEDENNPNISLRASKAINWNKTEFISKPTHQMAMKWLRKVHNIHIELNPLCYGDTEEDIKWHYGWAVKTTIFTDRWKRHNAEHISYEQACESAIKYCLENLI